MERSNKFISQEVLKLIACITMFIDHFGYAIVPRLAIANMETVYYICRIIGRLSFPIYCFLLAEGMRRTRNPRKYILRLGVGILLAEIPFDLVVAGGFSWGCQSVMVTLTLGAVMLLCIEKVEKDWLKLLLVLPFTMLAELTKSDYGGWGIAMIAVFALVDRFAFRFAGILLVSYLMPSAMIRVFGVYVSYKLAALFAMLPIGLYSGKKLTYSKAVQWGFYLFYPVHMLILWLMLQFGF